MPDLSRYNAFVEYLNVTENQLSYKFVLLECIIKNADSQGRADLQAIAKDFKAFYERRIKNGVPADKGHAAVTRITTMSEREVLRLILGDPYESIKKANWVEKVGNAIQIDAELWNLFTYPDKLDLLRVTQSRVRAYYQEEEQLPIEATRAKVPENSIANVLSSVHAYIQNKGFQFSYEDLANFYLCLKTKPFVIVAGVSGTGKSQLPRLFAEAVAAQWRIIPVRPDWNDGSDLLGYVDLEGKFRPGTLISMIQECNSAPSIPHIIVLDEMNLARVEHYLADLLSVMETRDLTIEGVQTRPLLENTAFPRAEDARTYAGLAIPDNLYIVGTVNMDETTHPFSKKVLDRANTIEFSEIDLAGYRTLKAGDATVVPLSNSQLVGCYLRLSHVPLESFRDDIVNRLVDVNAILNRASLSVGYRVRDEVVIYMTYNQELALLKDRDAFDFQLMQKILPRVQGSTQSIRALLLELLNLTGGIDLRASNDDVLRDLEVQLSKVNLSPYPRSAQKVAAMLRRFEEDGFTSYWI